MGHIEINAYLDKKDVVYEIIDDGIGFEPKEDLFKRKEKTALHKGGYGLYNVNERIKLEYGNGYGLKVKSTVGKGTKITIRIAARL
jgi:two-component system sensor histidine kinase YesM